VTQDRLRGLLPRFVFAMRSNKQGIGPVGESLAKAPVMLLAPKNPYPLKDATYECGHDPVGQPRVPFRVQYYAIAIVFLIFDVETAFLYPWGLVFRTLGWTAYAEMALFVAVLLVGLLYAWRKGALTWA
jgi:NADH-quinone oxidoreductase subunit A